MYSKATCIITDDEPKMVELLSDILTELYPEITILGEYTDWRAALAGIKRDKPDILFMDISMPEKSGFDLLELISDKRFEVIFVTAHTEYAIDAFNFDVCGYILKPINDKLLAKAVDRAIGRIETKRKAFTVNTDIKNYRIGIPDDSGIRYVNINEIMFCETSNRYTKVVTTEAEILSSYNIGRYQEILTYNIFYQIHRSFIININHVNRYDTTGFVIMNNGTEIPVSRKNKDEFLQLFNRISR